VASALSFQVGVFYVVFEPREIAFAFRYFFKSDSPVFEPLRCWFWPNLSYFASIIIAEKLAITLEPFLFHIQKNQSRAKARICFIDPQHRYSYCRCGSGYSHHFFFDNARLSGDCEE
jgi:hypothetical protein